MLVAYSMLFLLDRPIINYIPFFETSMPLLSGWQFTSFQRLHP